MARHAMNDVVDDGIAIVSFVLLCFTALVGVVLSLYAVYKICVTNAETIKQVDKCTVNSAVSCIILHGITCVLDPIGYAFWANGDERAAAISWILWDVFWTASRLNLYFVYIYRCFVTFKHTKYAYSAYLYILLIVAWLLQLLNMVIFIFHEADFLDNNTNPLHNNDALVVIAASTYIVLDLMIAFAVCYLFVNPLVKLMADLKTRSAQHISGITSSNGNIDELEHQGLVYNGHELQLAKPNTSGGAGHVQGADSDSSTSSDEDDLMTTPHSPTKDGAGYYSANNHAEHAVPKTPTKQPPASTTLRQQQLQLDDTSSMAGDIDASTMGTNLFKGVFGKLPCPEDAIANPEKKSMSDGEQQRMQTKFKFKLFGKTGQQGSASASTWNAKQTQLLHTGTRLALLSVIALSSGFIYQLIWILSVALNNLGSFSYGWGVDTVINIVCIYLSFQFAEEQYDRLCTRCCRCHRCCFKLIEKWATKYME